MIADATPTMIDASGTYRAIAVGARHVCAITKVGDTLHCWGAGTAGQLGDGLGKSSNAHNSLVGVWSAVAMGEEHACGLSDGKLFCWGANTYGQLGTGVPNSELSPKQVGTDEDWTAITAGRFHTCGTRGAASTLSCWGSQELGALGDGNAWRSTLGLVR